MKNFFQPSLLLKHVRTNVVPSKGDPRPVGAIPLKPAVAGLQHSALSAFSDNPTLAESRLHKAPRSGAGVLNKLLRSKLAGPRRHVGMSTDGGEHVDSPMSERDGLERGSPSRTAGSSPMPATQPAEKHAARGRQALDTAKARIAAKADLLQANTKGAARDFAIDNAVNVGGLLAVQGIDATGRGLAASSTVRAAVGWFVDLPSTPEHDVRPASKLNAAGFSLTTRAQAHVLKQSAASFARGATRSEAVDRLGHRMIDSVLDPLTDYLAPAGGQEAPPAGDLSHRRVPGSWVEDAPAMTTKLAVTGLPATALSTKRMAGAWNRLAAKPAATRLVIGHRRDDLVFNATIAASGILLDKAPDMAANSLKAQLPPGALNVLRAMPAFADLPVVADIAALIQSTTAEADALMQSGAAVPHQPMPGTFPGTEDDIRELTA